MNSKWTAGRWLAIGCAICTLSVCARASDDVVPLLEVAAKHRREGNVRLAIELLEKACKRAGTPPCAARLTGELGAAYYQAHRFAQAADALNEAYSRAGSATERALFANDLGNLSASRGRNEEAARYYEEARAEAEGNAQIAVSAGLNLARLAGPLTGSHSCNRSPRRSPQWAMCKSAGVICSTWDRRLARSVLPP